MLNKNYQDITKFTLLYDNILVKAIDIKSVGGIIRGKSSDNKPTLGEVISVGTGRLLDTGAMKEMDVKVGDVILFNQHMSTPYNLNKDKFYTISEEDCIGYVR